MEKMKCGFNQSVQECHSTVDLMTNTLTNDIRDKFKATEDLLSKITQKLKDQDNTITDPDYFRHEMRAEI
jgi:hypothetical protein